MATLHQLQQGLVKANQDGNEEHVAVFSDAIREHPTYQKQGQEALAKGFKALSGDERKQAIHQNTAKALGIKPSELDSERGMGVWGRTKLSFQPTQQDKVKHLEDTYGKENIRGVDIGGDVQFLYRDEDETGNKWRRVDEQGVSLADFTADIAGLSPEIGGAIAGGAKGAAVGSAAGPVGTIVGGILGAAGGGLAAGAAQDVAVRAASGEDIDAGEIASRRAKEAAIGMGIDAATLGIGRVAMRPFRSKLTKDAVAKTFGETQELVGEGVLTPRMLQGEEALTRELGLEPNVGGRVGDARKAIDQKVSDLISQADPAAYERFAQRVQAERAGLESAIPEGEAALRGRVEEYYSDALNRFGDSQGRVISNIGDDLIERSTNPALRESRNVKNRLYGEFDQLDEQVGGVFQPKDIVANIDEVISANRAKNAAGVKAIRSEIAKAETPYTIGEMDDLIGRITDAMPEGVVKDKTASQIASELSDNLGKLVERRAAQYPELNRAWRDANEYYKKTFLQFNKGAVGQSVRDPFSNIVSGQQFMNQVLSDPAEVRNLLSAAKEGGQSPSLVKGRVKEAWLESKGIRKGEPVKNLTLSSQDRSMIRELWGKRGLQRMEKISKGLEANPEQLDAYLGALSDKQANEIRKQLNQLDKDAKRLRQLETNKFMNDLANGDIPAGSPRGITESYLKLTKSRRDELFRNMDKAAVEDLKGTVGSHIMLQDIDASPFVGSMGENLFNGQSALRRLDNQAEKLRDLLGKKEFEQLRTLARAQSKLKPLSRDQAQTKLRTLAGPGGFSLYVVGDIIQAMKDKFIALAYRTKSLDGLMNGWSKLDEKGIEKALKGMLYGSQARRALNNMDDPELEQQVELLKSVIPE